MYNKIKQYEKAGHDNLGASFKVSQDRRSDRKVASSYLLSQRLIPRIFTSCIMVDIN